jgi:peroxiredoxin family protein
MSKSKRVGRMREAVLHFVLMADRVVFFVQRGSFEPAFQLASLAVTAAAMGDEVLVVFSFDALRLLVQRGFGKPETDKEAVESARGEGLGVLAPAKMLEEARKLGARLVACDTTVKLCGLGEESVRGVLDEVMGLASIWRLTQGARVLSI